MKKLKHNYPFRLESGGTLPELEIAYHTYGRLNERRDNVVWICHALTANSDAAEWWPGLVGEGKLFDPAEFFIVCANMPGSCYGSTGPRSVNPLTGGPYGPDFPLVTIRDMARALQLLQAHLGINRIKLAIGGSMGGQQVLEWAVMDPDLFDNICVPASNAAHSPWGIAFNEAQRMAIAADPSLYEDGDNAGGKGLEAARAIAMLSYRSYRSYRHTQSEDTHEKFDGFRASSYQQYQGLKLRRRFDPWSYLSLSKSMDSHNLGRGRESVEAALATIRAQALIIGIESDILFPVEEQIAIADGIPCARLEIIDSLYGHDGFLIEYEKIDALVRPLLFGKGFSPEKGRYRLRRGTGKTIYRALPGTESF